jgi:RNA polymerase sigma factor (sigma-70 family)
MSADRFEPLYAANREPILAYLVRRVDDPEDAADLLADVFLVAWRRIDEVPRGDGARMWLYGVARRALANHRRGDRRRTALTAALRSALPSPPDDDAGLAAALAALGDTDRELIALSAWDGLSAGEIGQLLGIRAATVRVRLHRARRRLEELLESVPSVS